MLITISLNVGSEKLHLTLLTLQASHFADFPVSADSVLKSDNSGERLEWEEGGGPILDGRDDMGENGAGRLDGKVTVLVLVSGLFDQMGMGVEEDRGEVAGDGAQWPQLIFGMSSGAAGKGGDQQQSAPVDFFGCWYQHPVNTNKAR
ncbi:hypothetical protein BY996DRAFT_6596630 [Phakopsora pachyrhizi]|nr:hypothetical protein BY996DRAFT_6596630 [Phakopsora pachyrhizi]